MVLSSLINKTKTLLSGTSTPNNCEKETRDTLFPVVDPAVDGEDCLHDCEGCPVSYPKSFWINQSDDLWGKVKKYEIHAIVATGKSDWKRDVMDEDGSVMQALGKHKPSGKSLMISGSNMPPPEDYYTAQQEGKPMPTTVLILPAFIMVDHVTPETTPELVRRFILPGPTTMTPLDPANATSVFESSAMDKEEQQEESKKQNGHKDGEGEKEVTSASAVDPSTTTDTNGTSADVSTLTNSLNTLTLNPSDAPNTLTSRPCPHSYIILLCSHRRRDARCGISAPIIAREFERQLRPLSLYRDLNDTRPGGVGLYFINHVGGHKYSANVLIYRKEDGMGLWLARVTPKHVEGIVKWTIVKGKVVHPEMVRGGFLRKEGKVSW